MFCKSKAIFYWLVIFTVVIPATKAHAQKDIRVAFISDIHLHNIYPANDSAALPYFYDSTSRKTVLIRTLASEMNSTRLFNENYYALQQALQEIADKGIQLVIVPGDCTDDGQLLNLQAVKDIFLLYQQQYHMRFLVTDGNHDVREPFETESGKSDFLSLQGETTGVYSSPSLLKKPNDQLYPPLKIAGYPAVFNMLQQFGFAPNEKDIFYNTPHHAFDYDTYHFDSAAFAFGSRWYHYGNDSFPDLTYVAEPVKDLWVMSIDGNIFKKQNDQSFDNIGDGYRFIQQKPFLLPWIQKVAVEAKQRGKTLIAFSHYPILDFNNGQSSALKKLLGARNFQLSRIPDDSIGSLFAASGLQVFFAGHMHINQHGYEANDDKPGIWNIQVPSLAAFPPAYKIATISKKKITIKTHLLKNVAHYADLFTYYSREKKDTTLQNQLRVSDHYDQFTKNHLKYLANNRFYTDDFGDSKWNTFKQSTPIHWVNENFLQRLTAKERKQFLLLSFKDIVFDLYLVRNGNDYGLKEIASSRLRLYRKWALIATENKAIASALDELIIIMQQMTQHSLPTKKTVIRLAAG